MREGRAVTLLMLLAIGLAGVWCYLRGDDTGRTDTVEVSEDVIERSNLAPLELRGNDAAAALHAQEAQSTGASTLNHVEAPSDESDAPQPVLDTLDYGVAIQRGRAVADFELRDATGYMVPSNAYAVKLWRKVGKYWIQDEARNDPPTNVIRCDGLSGGTGLEPGEYELELTSNDWGNFRHEFSVTRGEYKTERLTTPYWRQLVCFHFTDGVGNPVSHLPAYPSVKTVSDPLQPVDRPVPGTVWLRQPPENMGIGGGLSMGWGGAGDGNYTTRLRKRKPPLYPTDDGNWYVYVQAGGENTVSFSLGQDIWGQGAYTITDRFIGVARVEVALNTAADFAAKLSEYGMEVETTTPGNRPEKSDAVAITLRPFDPYTAEIAAGKTRVIMDLQSKEDVSVQISTDGEKYWDSFSHGDIYWFDFDSDKQYWIRYESGQLFETAWQPLDVSIGGLLVVNDSVVADHANLGTDNLSPTLRAFGVRVEFQLARRLPDPTEEVTDKDAPDPSDQPNEDLAVNPNSEYPNPHPAAWDQPFNYEYKRDRQDSRTLLPDIAESLYRLSVSTRRDLLVGGEKVETTDFGEGLLARTWLQGAARYHKGLSGSCSVGPDGRTPYMPLVLNGNWREVPTSNLSLKEMLVSGELQPEFQNLLIARAVGPQTEGLPWVKGVLLDYEDDDIAQQVRQIVKGWDEYKSFNVDDADGFMAKLEAVKQDRSGKRLRDILGDDLYEAFETDDQREWFARQGAWYDTHRKVYGDDHGYIAVESPRLKPGKCYVLYLWSNSRNDCEPDARVAFRVDDNGVADLGAIHLPSYTG